MKKIAILGSTGSIGTQTLDVIDRNPDKFSVVAVCCGSRVTQLEKQIEKYRPRIAVTANEADALSLQKKFPHIEMMHGNEGLIAASSCDCDMVVNSLMGIKGMVPTYHGIKAGHDIALANKETLVAGGKLIMQAVRENKIRLLPVDSEHSAIFQCLQGNSHNSIKRIILTASGGPFRGYTPEKLRQVTIEQTLAHPKWNMGKKITVDSATLMNKGLEVIEAKWLFNVALDQIDVAVHPQSIVHSAVEFEDSAVIAQLGLPDMRVPISYAINYPDRCVNKFESLDFFGVASNLTFEEPDTETFKCLRIAFESLRKGGLYPAVMNGANEALVMEFLKGDMTFTDIPDTLEKVVEKFDGSGSVTLEGILEADRDARIMALEMLKKGKI